MIEVQSDRNRAILFIFSSIILFCVIQYNIFGSVNMGWFKGFQADSESLVIGRLVKSREDGIFSAGGALGRFDVSEEKINTQTSIYLNKLKSGTVYDKYNSQIGGQGIIYSGLDNLLSLIGVKDPKIRLNILHITTSSLLALVLSFIVVFFYLESGIFLSIAMLLTFILSQWLIVIGKNLYWSVWLMYLPMVVIIAFHKYEELNRPGKSLLSVIAIYIIFFMKSASGYEYLSTIMIATITPIFYFSVKNNWQYRKLVKRVLLFGFASFFGFLSALLLHLVQLFQITKSFPHA